MKTMKSDDANQSDSIYFALAIVESRARGREFLENTRDDIEWVFHDARKRWSTARAREVVQKVPSTRLVVAKAKNVIVSRYTQQ